MQKARKLKPNQKNKVGDIIVYGFDTNNNGKLDPNEIMHSSIVVEVDAKGNTVRVWSKEGQGPITDHHPSDALPDYGTFKEWYRK